VTIADIIGDVDPIRAARGGHVLSDELSIHYGLLPRANRGIFAINELPDLAGKIQVGLFNIMQEGDVQIKGYPVRIALDVCIVFTANPEDYTARGKIITPLKDRIGAEILTHYPLTVDSGIEITQQEAWTERGAVPICVPRFLREMIERIAFEAREDPRVDRRSGVSQRLPISVLESAISNAERRALVCEERMAVPRVSDLYAALPAITGKLELEYEGELQGRDTVARDLVIRAAGATFDEHFDEHGMEAIVAYFDQGGALQVSDTASADACLKGFRAVPTLLEVVRGSGVADESQPGVLAAAAELVLEGLVAKRKISRTEAGRYTRTKPSRPKGPPFPKPPFGEGPGSDLFS
jgi:magnesium chelatase subunit I